MMKDAENLAAILVLGLVALASIYWKYRRASQRRGPVGYFGANRVHGERGVSGPSEERDIEQHPPRLRGYFSS
jgi:hypothetical protein